MFRLVILRDLLPDIKSADVGTLEVEMLFQLFADACQSSRPVRLIGENRNCRKSEVQHINAGWLIGLPDLAKLYSSGGYLPLKNMQLLKKTHIVTSTNG
ncbi:hypothetical protein J6590_057123 [Homalodisca vitripennis]|nr:hypothetical protein J6590_057123 [Homalodisca vitripennis]